MLILCGRGMLLRIRRRDELTGLRTATNSSSWHVNPRSHCTSCGSNLARRESSHPRATGVEMPTAVLRYLSEDSHSVIDR
jgi:hypothetical protein